MSLRQFLLDYAEVAQKTARMPGPLLRFRTPIERLNIDGYATSNRSSCPIELASGITLQAGLDYYFGSVNRGPTVPPRCLTAPPIVSAADMLWKLDVSAEIRYWRGILEKLAEPARKE